MSVNSVITHTYDLETPLVITPLRHALATGDQLGDRFDIAVTQKGQPVDLTGAGVTGYFIRTADGATVVVTGSASGNVASVTLPESCYAVPGRFTLTIKVSLDDVRHAVYVGEGAVLRSSTDTIIDPGHEIPDLDELLAMIAELEAAISAANTATTKANDAAGAANAAKTNADRATTAANNAASAANTAKTNADAATKKANDAAASATTAAGSANSAATAANAAKTAADTAASAANISKASADTAAANANAKADYLANATFTAHNVDPGGNATVTKTDKDGHAHFDFGLVKGDPGEGDVSSIWGALPDDTGDAKPAVGGRNYVKGAYAWPNWSGWRTPNYNVYNQLFQVCVVTLPDDKKINEPYTLSVEIEFEDVTASGNMNFRFFSIGNRDGSWDNETTLWPRDFVDITKPPENGIMKFTKTVKLSEGDFSAGEIRCFLRVDAWASGRFRHRFTKIEKGVVPTDWSPAPEDAAASADKLSHTRRINLDGDVTGGVSFDGSGDVTITTSRRGCAVGSEGAITEGRTWYKFASVVQQGAAGEKHIVFLVNSGGFPYTVHDIGTLYVHVRPDGAYVDAKIEWHTAGPDVNPNDFALTWVKTSDSSWTFSLWCNAPRSWLVYHFDVLSEGNRRDRAQTWTLYNNITVPGTALPTGETVVYSTVAPLKGTVSSVFGVQPDENGDAKPEIGGVNLLDGTRDFGGNWTNIPNKYTKDGSSYLGLSVVSSTIRYSGPAKSITVEPGTYTFSCYAKGEATSNYEIYLVYSEAQSEGVSPYYAINCKNNGDWQRYAVTFEVSGGPRPLLPRFEKSSNDSSTTYICGYKLERGSVPTDWSPAPEDTINPPNSGLYDGKNLKTVFGTAAAFHNAVAAGDFSKIRVGDYFPIALTGTVHDYAVDTDKGLGNAVMNMEVAAINPYFNYGDSGDLAAGKNHVVLCSRDLLPWAVRFRSAWGNWLNAEAENPWVGSWVYETLNNATNGVLPLLLATELGPYVYAGADGKGMRWRGETKGHGATVASGSAWYDRGRLFLPSEREVWGSSIWSEHAPGGGTALQWPIFSGSSRHIFKRLGNGGSGFNWFTASSLAGSDGFICVVESSSISACTYPDANDWASVPLCFVLV